MSEDRYKWYVVRKEILETHIVRASSLEGAREKVKRGFSKAQEKDTGQIRVIEFKLPEEPE